MFIDIKKRFAIKLISLVVWVFFLFQQISWAQGGDFISWQYAKNREQDGSAVYDIQVPYKYGEIKQVYRNRSDIKLIHIQDAHASLCAQYSITGLLDDLLANYNLDFIALEGAEGKIDTSAFRSFPDKNVKKIVMSELVEKGLMGAGEFFAIMKEEDIALYGVENEQLYWRNLSEFCEIAEERKTLIINVEGAMEQLKTLGRGICSPELTEFNRISFLHRENGINFSEYWKRVHNTCNRLNIDVTGFYEVNKFIDTIALEKKIDFEAANRQRLSVITRLNKCLDKKSLEELIYRTVEFKENEISAARYHSYLVDLAEKKDFSPGKYTELIKFTRYISVYESLDILKLRAQIFLLEEVIREKLYRNHDERRLYEFYVFMYTLKLLYRAELTNSDYLFIRENTPGYDVGEISAFIKSKCSEHGVEKTKGYDIDLIFSGIGKACRFYETAVCRERCMIENTLADMRKEGRKVGALVTGGYHTQGLTKIMREKKLSYMVVAPRYDTGKDRPYIAVLTGKNNIYKKILNADEYNIAAAVYMSSAGKDEIIKGLFSMLAIEKLRGGDVEKVKKLWQAAFRREKDKKILSDSEFNNIISNVSVEKIGRRVVVVHNGKIVLVVELKGEKYREVEPSENLRRQVKARNIARANMFPETTGSMTSAVNGLADALNNDAFIKEITAQLSGRKIREDDIFRLLKAKGIDISDEIPAEVMAFVDKVLTVIQPGDKKEKTPVCNEPPVKGEISEVMKKGELKGPLLYPELPGKRNTLFEGGIIALTVFSLLSILNEYPLVGVIFLSGLICGAGAEIMTRLKMKDNGGILGKMFFVIAWAGFLIPAFVDTAGKEHLPSGERVMFSTIAMGLLSFFYKGNNKNFKNYLNPALIVPESISRKIEHFDMKKIIGVSVIGIDTEDKNEMFFSLAQSNSLHTLYIIPFNSADLGVKDKSDLSFLEAPYIIKLMKKRLDTVTDAITRTFMKQKMIVDLNVFWSLLMADFGSFHLEDILENKNLYWEDIKKSGTEELFSQLTGRIKIEDINQLIAGVQYKYMLIMELLNRIEKGECEKERIETLTSVFIEVYTLSGSIKKERILREPAELAVEAEAPDDIERWAAYTGKLRHLKEKLKEIVVKTPGYHILKKILDERREESVFAGAAVIMLLVTALSQNPVSFVSLLFYCSGSVIIYGFAKNIFSLIKKNREGRFADIDAGDIEIIVGIDEFLYSKLTRQMSIRTLARELGADRLIPIKKGKKKKTLSRVEKETEGKKVIFAIVDESAANELDMVCADTGYLIVDALSRFVKSSVKEILRLRDMDLSGMTREDFEKTKSINELKKAITVYARLIDDVKSMDLAGKSIFDNRLTDVNSSLLYRVALSDKARRVLTEGIYESKPVYISLSAGNAADLRFIASTIRAMGLDKEKASQFIQVRVAAGDIAERNLGKYLDKTGLSTYLDRANIIYAPENDFSLGEIILSAKNLFSRDMDISRLVVGAGRDIIRTDLDKALMKEEKAPLFVQMKVNEKGQRGIASQLFWAMAEVMCSGTDIPGVLGTVRNKREYKRWFIFLPDMGTIDYERLKKDMKQYATVLRAA